MIPYIRFENTDCKSTINFITIAFFFKFIVKVTITKITVIFLLYLHFQSIKTENLLKQIF